MVQLTAKEQYIPTSDEFGTRNQATPQKLNFDFINQTTKIEPLNEGQNQN
ncbi:MAG: hypothetical protein F6K09_14535, partial [Merismopedia sp. SIO2A8]|nr:hypothetical protein [Merismopedia sp. SIO2A8]